MKILCNFQDWNHNEQRRLEDAYGGVGYYRIVKPSQFIKGHEVELIGQELKRYGKGLDMRYDNLFKDVDVYWTSYFCEGKTASAMFTARDKYSKKVIIDVDDNYLDILPTNPIYDKFRPTKKDRAYLSTTLFFADAITVSTEPLKQRLFRHFKDVHGVEKKIFVIPNMNDLKDWNFETKKNTGKVIIGYPGSNSHYDDLKLLLPVIGKLLAKYPNLYFEAIGVIERDMLNLFEDFSPTSLERCDILSGTWTFNEYPPLMAARNWDIGIAPLVDSAFTRCKSHIKFMEFASLKIPCVASEVYPYFMDIGERRTIEHEKTGLLVKPSQWFDALEFYKKLYQEHTGKEQTRISALIYSTFFENSDFYNIVCLLYTSDAADE